MAVTSPDAVLLADVIRVLDELYPPALAESWDAVGLVVGEPDRPVHKVAFAVDPVPTVVAEAIAWNADLLVTHHPLLLQPVHGVAATTPAGRIVRDLVKHDCALFTAHTNADSAVGGVNDALASALGLRDVTPLVPGRGEVYDKIVTFVPPEHAQSVADAMTDVGAGTIGEYLRCTWHITGDGSFLPTERAQPMIGEPGRVERTHEARVEVRAPRPLREQVIRALVAAHPYEEAAYDVYELAPAPRGVGLGRVGRLATPQPLADFVRDVAHALPATSSGVRFSGEPAAVVERVAVCGGAGGSIVPDAVRAGADVVVTADLRHHVALDQVVASGTALVDAGHFATEWPWLPRAAERLVRALEGSGTTVGTHVSTLVTDPWTASVPSREEPR
jgi:dinuclear metal center YbgI/SA1388 family protein